MCNIERHSQGQLIVEFCLLSLKHFSALSRSHSGVVFNTHFRIT